MMSKDDDGESPLPGDRPATRLRTPEAGNGIDERVALLPLRMCVWERVLKERGYFLFLALSPTKSTIYFLS